MKPLRWHAQGSFTAFIREGSKKLVFVVSQTDKWAVIALETDGDDVAAVLASHAHQNLGDFDTVSEAFAVCETYAANWRAGKRTDPCECEEIEAPAKSIEIDAEFEEPVAAHVEGKTDQ